MESKQPRGKTTAKSNHRSFAAKEHPAAEVELTADSRVERLMSLDRVMRRHAGDFDRLAAYDRGELPVPDESPTAARIDLTDVELIVDELRARYPADERLGIAKDDGIHAVLGQIDATFMGENLYDSAQEKAANLIYMVVKDHPFADGNKRTAAALFAYYLDRNGVDIEKAIPGSLLTAITLIATTSDPALKTETVALIRALIAGE